MILVIISTIAFQVYESLMIHVCTKELHFSNYCSDKMNKLLIKTLDLWTVHNLYAISWDSCPIFLSCQAAVKQWCLPVLG